MSRIRADQILNGAGTGAPNFSLGLQVGAATTVHTSGIDLGSGNIQSNNINSTGIITAASGSFSGNVSVGGTLTYEDVTSIDSVGVITAKSGINVTAGGINAVGVVTATTFTGNLTGNVTGDLTGNLAGTSSIAGISSAISDTAVDVFVYDTSKDSDGGAWRKRTQNTSWYNETLNTSTRGSRKEFPAVAVIVAETTQVTIYDGDDPDLPMWMVFNQTGGSDGQNRMLNRFMGNLKSVSMLNGNLTIFGNSTSSADRGGGVWINFISEFGYAFGTNDSQGENIYGTLLHNIAQRNTILGTDLYADKIQRYQLVDNSQCNDVAMTVLPNAPVDDTTGLPIPTIAVATNGGVSVIRDDGSVVDIIQNSPYTQSHNVFFSDYGKILYDNEDTQVVYEVDIPLDDIGYGVYNSTQNGRVIYPVGDHGGFSGGEIRLLGSNISNGGRLITKGAFAVDENGATESDYGPVGLSLFDRAESDPAKQSLVAYVASDYNTGWMHGDIKGAFLSDTDTTNATDSQKVNWNNGSDTSGSYGGATAQSVTVVSNTSITITAASGGYAYYDVGFTPVSGKKYVAVLTGSNYSGSGPYGLSTGGGFSINMRTSANGTVGPEVITSNGSAINIFVATGLTVTVTLTIYELAEEDRSVNNTGLQVFGTITKSAVATGADLVAYSSFNSSNRLTSIQPEINFGSSPNATICFTSWVKQPTTGDYSYIMSIQDGNTSSSIGMAVDTSTGHLYVYDGTNVSSSTTNIVDGYWHHCVGIINGSNILAYVDGREVLNTTTANPPAATAIDRFHIGHYRSGSTLLYHFRGSLALSRISKSIPTPEQVKRMYEDEKCLFQENAKATLYGSSDAVTALAFDDDTNLLHVGTSAGRSDFQGLRRINNTTTAVTTAISASDGLVAEQ